MAVVLLDTTVLIDVLRGRPVVERLRWMARQGDVAATSPVNIEEVVRGLRRAEASAADALFDGLHVVPLDRAAGERAGRWRRDFAARGRTLAQADCLVAAAALASGGRIATGNPRDFPMAEVAVDHWPVGR